MTEFDQSMTGTTLPSTTTRCYIRKGPEPCDPRLVHRPATMTTTYNNEEDHFVSGIPTEGADLGILWPIRPRSRQLQPVPNCPQPGSLMAGNMGASVTEM